VRNVVDDAVHGFWIFKKTQSVVLIPGRLLSADKTSDAGRDSGEDCRDENIAAEACRAESAKSGAFWDSRE